MGFSLKKAFKGISNNRFARAASPAAFLNLRGIQSLGDSGYVGKEAKAAQQSQAQAQEAGGYLSQNLSPEAGKYIQSLGGPVAGGAAFGTSLGNTMYGQSMGQTGGQIQDIIGRRKAALEGNDLASNRLRSQAGRDIASSRASAAMAGQRGSGMQQFRESAIRRMAGRDIASAEFAQQQQALNDYQKTIGAVASGQGQMLFQGAGLGSASQPVPVAKQVSPWDIGGAGSVICTELHNQGLLDTETYLVDSTYGHQLSVTEPEVIIGYHFLAKPIVKLMKKSKLFTKFVSLFALPWANNIAGRTNVTGKFILFTGKPFCKFVGKLLIKGEKYVRA